MSLTDQNELPDYLEGALSRRCNHWRSVLELTKPVNKTAASKSLQDLCELLNCKPELTVHCESPWQAAMAYAALRSGATKELFDEKAPSWLPSDIARKSDNLLRRLWVVLDEQVPKSERAALASKSMFGWTGVSEPFPFGNIPFIGPHLGTKVKDTNSERNILFELLQLHRALLTQVQGVCEARLKDKPRFQALRQLFDREFGARARDNPIGQIRNQLALLSPPLRFMSGETVPRPDAEDLFRFGIESLRGNFRAEIDKYIKPADLKAMSTFMHWTVAAMHLQSQPALDQLPLYEFLLDELDWLPVGPTNKRRLRAFLSVSMNTPYYLITEKFCIIGERPSILKFDDRGQLHCEDGIALAYRDSLDVYSWHGTTVSREIIESPQSIKVSSILNERNAEIRRVMIDRYGASRFIIDSGAEKVHEDECGVLYRHNMADDEPLVMVKVVNSTPEPDGTYRTYFLRVPPNIVTAREAVAWTFEMAPKEYDPHKQT